MQILPLETVDLYPGAVPPDGIVFFVDALGNLYRCSVSSLYQGVGVVSHGQLQDKGVNSHTEIDTHIADASKHFTQAQIDHVNVLNKGVNSHSQIDTHIADASKHFTQAQIDHVNVLNKGINSHAQIDGYLSTCLTHVADFGLHLSGAANGTFSFGGSWNNYGNGWPGLSVNRNGIGQVRVCGMVCGGYAGVIATLSANCRPSVNRMFSCLSSAGQLRVDVYPDGRLEMISFIASPLPWLCLDNILF